MKTRWTTHAFALFAAALSLTPAQVATHAVGASKVGALADLASGIVRCSIHPCLGDSRTDVTAALGGRIVTDGVFYYSDLKVAYPMTRGTLRGLVEWGFGSGALETISLKIVEFHAGPQALRDELEQTLQGCSMDDEDGDPPATDEDIPEASLSCMADGNGEEGVTVDAYFAPDLLILELGP